mgnify:FL=1
MKEVVRSLIITFSALVSAIVMKEKIRYWFYVLLFFGLLAIGFIFDKLEADDAFHQHFKNIEMQSPIPDSSL